MPDADVVIYLSQAGLWDSVATHYHIAIPSIVFAEAQFYRDDDGVDVPIDLSAYVRRGEVTVLEASPADLAALSEEFDPLFLEGLHAGEQEAIALVRSGQFSHGWFCCGDRTDQVALVLLGHSKMLVSVEGALKAIGRSLTKSLRRHAHLTDRVLKLNISDGNTMLITGMTYTRSPIRSRR